MSRRPGSPIVFIFVAVSFLMSVRDAMAEIYRYLDDNGIICFADQQEVIPEKYRGRAVVVSKGLSDPHRS